MRRLRGGKIVIFMRLDVVLGDTFAFGLDVPEPKQGLGVWPFCRQFEQLQCFRVILRNTPTFVVHQSEMEKRIRVPPGWRVLGYSAARSCICGRPPPPGLPREQAGFEQTRWECQGSQRQRPEQLFSVRASRHSCVGWFPPRASAARSRSMTHRVDVPPPMSFGGNAVITALAEFATQRCRRREFSPRNREYCRRSSNDRETSRSTVVKLGRTGSPGARVQRYSRQRSSSSRSWIHAIAVSGS